MIQLFLNYNHRILIKNISKRYLTILPMPKLSPSIKSCKLIKWYIKENIQLSLYDLICEIETTSLTQTQNEYEITKLDLEIQEECLVGKLLYNEGDNILPGSPIAILVDNSNELEIIRDLNLKINEIDVYNQSKYQMAGWQAYIKNKELKDSSSCGCW